MAKIKKLTKKIIQSTFGYNFLGQFSQFSRVARSDIRQNLLGQLFPLKPTKLNLLVNDICNSQCQMCSIWKRKLDSQFTPAELALILQDPLFSRLENVGVSGGEPTLRADLPEIYRVLARKDPPLQGVNLITNAINTDDVISRIMASARVCSQRDLSLAVMVSLDGVGHVHDRVRGRKGNFESALAVIRYLRDKTDIGVSIGCTITRDNVWHVEEVLDFCRREGIAGRFRVAEFIDRLYNADQADYIRSFTPQEAYHLALFFAKLEYTYEANPWRKRTYRNIRRMLGENRPRSIKCAWQSIGVTLDCRGQLLYCAPRSPILGSCLEESAERIYHHNIGERKTILKQHCSDCIHDYRADQTLAEWWAERNDRAWRHRLALDRALTEAKSRDWPRSASPPRRILIVGWYGTETAGDKAILGQIIYQARRRHPGCTVILASLYPFLSRHTVRELGYPDIQVIPAYSAAFWRHTKTADQVIMGGGPLMHLEQLGLVLWAFMRARQAGHMTHIAGCGLGPLDRGQKYRDAVRYILQLADTVELRDSQSVAWAARMTGRTDIKNNGDPALAFVRRWREQHSAPPTRPHLNLYLREWPPEYQGRLAPEQFRHTKALFEQNLARWIQALCAEFNLQPRLLPMHHFCIGNDDRDFNRHFARTYLAGLDPIVEQAPLPLQDVLASMQEATLCLCMRFHSVLFASTLGVPFFALDYTQGGKINAFLADHNRLDRMLSLQEIAAGAWRDKLYLPGRSR